METNNKLFLKHKYDYLKLSDKISKIRFYGDEVPVELLLQAHKIGCLAQIPDNELNALLFDLKTQ